MSSPRERVPQNLVRHASHGCASFWVPSGLVPLFCPYSVERETGRSLRNVHCTVCHRDERVENGLADGWPKCCGYTMTIDSHEERCI